ncbi:MAG: 50S ribosomal protein L24e [Candidatus Micrarchaeota archaeon]|nr:50S ribosomal protein L24e [Candidatus Micrarchaeota archaeon]
MPNCSFCSETMAKGTGALYAKKDGSIFYFCSSKCRKNQLLMGREGRRKKWTKSARIFKGKEKKATS